MTSVLASEISLYELVAGSTSAPFAMQVSPVTFKALMSSLLDLLVEQNDTASVWVKLPKGDAWQTEFDRYLERAGADQQIHCFKNQRDDNPDADLKQAFAGLERTGTNQPSTVLVSPESPLRREYFLLIWSKQFCGLLVGHRARLAPVLREGDTLVQVDEDGTEKKQSLMAFLVVDPIVVREAIASLQPLMPRSATLPEWETFDPMLVNQLLTKHIQRQEELWQRASTHRKQAEMANLLQLQNEELLSTIRLKDEFLHNVGQELRTPLTNMKTALTLLNSPSLKPPQKQRYMDLLARECDRQSSLITSLLDLVSLDQMAEQTTVQALSLGDIVPGVVSTYQPLAEEKGVRLAYTIPENLPAISCFPTWLKQIVINLLHNGIKFTPRGGQVWVRAKQQGDYVQLEFRDTGIGIAAGEIPKIFDRFYRVRQAVDEDMGGAGLGLTIVQKLLLHCGGSISVKSRVGDGSTFNVLLPIYRGSEEG
ncbi:MULTISPECIES: ATP-binding protein [Leptolyngbya]|uniref:histidine kinase n=2 Tax=Leptolyngbya boryana TaxID=1184 RepID=A0A1Z4JBG1_LEPBY|nr:MULTISPECIES: ATP-binding protein [Leptolyngbya]BAY54043.1 two-component sensor histidine kinase [Leptolyngbya boryana NIES-2135]MBD1856015.1 histidine kinase [Leptolyngbya sp. FACHB-1624]MBD2369700.1 histidine kinase [Leptolyngbya sp. FACHB-161]MBD2376099.1 histidine kinase [Leptolyngbya sp. FACHB-238]MBD2400375.1 histidine kinase [Leptolyngbya sp. FACHB-239]